MTVKLGMTHAQLINAINSDIGLIKDQGSKIITKEFPASGTETSSVQLDTKCQSKDYMFVFMDYGILEPSNYSLSPDGLTVNFSPAIPANHKIIIRYFTPGSSFTNYVTDEFQSNLLNYTTNRILEIPQDIKLELNNGTLKLKAGSKVYVPNGFEADGTTPKFDVVVIENDKIVSTYEFAGYGLVIYNVNSETPDAPDINYFYSGTTPPNSGIFYNTADNTIKHYSNGSVSLTGYCLPLAKIYNSNGTITSIDQVFNGFGYIGSTVFALPGVKVQIPNGRNADGTYKSIYGTIRTVQQTSVNPGNGDFSIRIGDNYIAVSKFVYDEETNYNYNQTVSSSYIRYQNNAGTVSYLSGRITSLKPFTVDSVANSNASNFSQAGRSYLSGLGMPSNKYIDLTLGATGATYTAPANGWFYLNGISTSDGAYGYLSNPATEMKYTIQAYSVNVTIAGYLPCKKGDVIICDYGAFTKQRFRFIYAEGEN